jgi:SNF2 family DNA or RNA helicase
LKALQEQMGSTYFSLANSLEKLAHNDRLSKSDQERLQYFARQALEITKNDTAGNGKIEQLVAILSSFKDKMIVFTKFKTTQTYLVEELKKLGFKVAEFHGGLRRKEKEEQVTYFRDEADVFVSTEVGGEGRNLQFCHGMINYDLPWNPMAIEQRIGRIHRIGQQKDVYVYNLVAKKTIEHHILNLLDRKINMFELVVGEVDMILGDIEENADFSDLIMDAWIKSENELDMERELDQIGKKMLENKQKLLKQKVLDEKLF